MSTFNGIVAEFPRIRIDYFRTSPHHPPPLACFLSHVHSDHLQGLESLKAPFVYCSPATKEILLRLEKYPHRMNFAKGILETRLQTYRHLKLLLKTIPLEAPTIIELSLGEEIRVTLFDANHCVGAVMFLVQGDGKAILYTGDVRSELWWINSLVQNPVLLPYTLGPKRLDKLYLDTTFASRTIPFHEFPSKAEGLRELLAKIDQYPQDTVFYLEAWTFGYENVWIALSNYLQTPVHLDPYRWALYKSLSGVEDGPGCPEGAALTGFKLGNHIKHGCLTSDSRARLHSCEKGHPCAAIDKIGHFVRIVPVVTRASDGTEVHEMGIGGGKGDLDQVHELEVRDAASLGLLFQLCAAKIEDRVELAAVSEMLASAFRNEKTRLRLELDVIEAREEKEDLTLDNLLAILIKLVKRDKSATAAKVGSADRPHLLPSTITFPYSRHSSYSELCALVQAFKPRDIYPCTVDAQTWSPADSMRNLFGHLCSADIFAHDLEMMAQMDAENEQTDAPSSESHSASVPGRGIESQDSEQEQLSEYFTPKEAEAAGSDRAMPAEISHMARNRSPDRSCYPSQPAEDSRLSQRSNSSQEYQTRYPSDCHDDGRPQKRTIRQWAYYAATGMDKHCDSWEAFGGLCCIKGQEQEPELGNEMESDVTKIDLAIGSTSRYRRDRSDHRGFRVR